MTFVYHTWYLRDMNLQRKTFTPSRLSYQPVYCIQQSYIDHIVQDIAKIDRRTLQTRWTEAKKELYINISHIGSSSIMISQSMKYLWTITYITSVILALELLYFNCRFKRRASHVARIASPHRNRCWHCVFRLGNGASLKHSSLRTPTGLLWMRDQIKLRVLHGSKYGWRITLKLTVSIQ